MKTHTPAISDGRNEVSTYVSMSSTVPVQASTDAQVVNMWLHGKSPATQKSYHWETLRFAEHVGKPLRDVTLGDVQAYASSLEHYKPATQARALAAVKSLFTFAHRIGYIAFDPAAVVQLPKRKDDLAARIMPEAAVQRILATTTGRNHAIVRLLYGAGLRAAELVGLRWKDVQPREDAGQVTVYGKGGKTRAVKVSRTTWDTLEALRTDTTAADAPVFVSRKKHGQLTTVQVFRIVRDAAKNAGIPGNVSPHWLRHCHASHALDRQCPIHLLQGTLGHASVSTTSRYLHARPDASSSEFVPA